ncbi:MAG: PduL/EutD family phosphate acyltransferase, partial [Eubacteriales bacterium]
MYDEKLIAEAVKKAIEQLSAGDEGQIKIGISARHVHLSREDLDTLFGKGFELTKKKTLMGREFASEQVVTLVGPSLKAIENVRVL